CAGRPAAASGGDRVSPDAARRHRRDARERGAVSRIIGIDLGTTNSLVAFLGDDGPVVVPDPETGARLLPSAVAFLPSGEVVVGERARELVIERPLDTILSVKRFMGLGIEHVTPEDRRRYPFVEGREGAVRFAVDGREVTPPEVSSYILRELKRWAETALGEAVTQAVITVPAYFNDSQRQATKDAGRLAGLEVLRLVNEPTAAPRAEVVLALPGHGPVRGTVTRAEFEALIEEIVRRTAAPCRRALKDAGLEPRDVREVVAVGGATRVPLVRREMQAIFHRPPLVDLNPDEVVALGAGIQAGILGGSRRDMLLLDVVPLSLGIETMGGVFTRLVDRNTTIPVSVKESFDHAEDDVLQRQVREARVGADMILHATREQLAREATVLQPDEGERILAALRSLETLRDGQDYLAIRDAIEALSQASEPFARRIMDRSLNEALAQRRLEEL